MSVPKDTGADLDVLKSRLGGVKDPEARLGVLLELVQQVWRLAPSAAERAIVSAADELRPRAEVEKLEERLSSARVPLEQLGILLALGEKLWIVGPEEAKPYLERAVRLAEQEHALPELAKAANMLAEISLRAGEIDLAEKCVETSLQAARVAGSKRSEVGALNLLGRLHQARGDYGQARESYETAQRLGRDSGFLDGEQAALNQLGGLFGLQGLPEKALECYRQLLAVDEQRGDNYGRALDHYNIGWALEQMGEWEEAAENLYRAIALSEQQGFRDLRLDAMNTLGEVFLKRDKLEKAIDMFQTVIEVEREQMRYQQLLRDALVNLGRAHFRAGDLGAAERAYGEARLLCEQSEDRRELAIVTWRMAELALAQGHFDRAAQALDEASMLADELGLRREAGEVLRVRARLQAEQGQTAEAVENFRKALAIFGEMGDSYELARARLQYGRFLVGTGDREAALTPLRLAARSFGRLSVVAQSEQANRLVFQLEMPSDSETAVLGAVRGLLAVGLEPMTFLDRVLTLLCEGFGYESAAVLMDDRLVAVRGAMSLKKAAKCSRTELVVSAQWVCLPVPSDGGSAGAVYLERSAAVLPAPRRGTLEQVAGLLCGPMTRLASLPVRLGVEQPGVPGVRYQGVAGKSRRVLDNLKVVGRVASAAVPVLVRGESGTGKELIARALHDSGERRDKPFVAVNCAAVPEGLLEAEFFGVERGAATGVVRRKGKLELADEGTVFLDEVGDMSHALQARLLRVLQEKSFERLGGEKPVKVDVRIVAATNKDLAELMRQGRFREDLYYRLNAVEISLPALRERKEDIPDLVRHFVGSSNQEFSRGVIGASDAAMALFLAYDWPGNIRQLKHVIERAVILAKGTVLEPSDLPVEFQAVQVEDAGPERGFKQARQEAQERATAGIERAMLLEYLEKAGWNVSQAATLAGYSRAQFYRLMRKHNLSRPK